MNEPAYRPLQKIKTTDQRLRLSQANSIARSLAELLRDAKEPLLAMELEALARRIELAHVQSRTPEVA